MQYKKIINLKKKYRNKILKKMEQTVTSALLELFRQSFREEFLSGALPYSVCAIDDKNYCGEIHCKLNDELTIKFAVSHPDVTFTSKPYICWYNFDVFKYVFTDAEVRILQNIILENLKSKDKKRKDIIQNKIKELEEENIQFYKQIEKANEEIANRKDKINSLKDDIKKLEND